MKKFNYSFQGLRGIFAIGVLFSHCYFLADFSQSAVIFEDLLKKLANVSFFFMLSGYFAVQSNLNGVSFWNYMKKKMLRIFPLYIIILTLHIGIRILERDLSSPADLLYLVLNVFLLQGFGGLAAMSKFYMVSWFLSSLLFCYMVVYWLVKLKNKNEPRFWKNIYILVSILLLLKCTAAIIFPTGDMGYYLCYLFPFAGFTDFLIGVVLSHLSVQKVKITPRKQLFLQLLSIVFLCISFSIKPYIPVNYSRAFAMIPATALLIYAFAVETNLSKKIFGNKFMLFLGNISFEVYLLHVLIISLLTRLSIFKFFSTKFSPFLTLLICILITILCAHIYRIIYNYTLEKIKKIRG